MNRVIQNLQCVKCARRFVLQGNRLSAGSFWLWTGFPFSGHLEIPLSHYLRLKSLPWSHENLIRVEILVNMGSEGYPYLADI